MTEPSYSCSAEEVHVLDQIKAWPGIPAIVTYHEDGRWSVTTEPEEIEQRVAGLRTGTTHQS